MKGPDYKNQKVLILGLGVNQGGAGAARFFALAGAKVRVTDLKVKEELKPSLDILKEFKNIEYVLGKHQKEDIDWADLIIRNPALKPDNPWLKYALEKKKKVEMDLGIFFEFVSPKQVIGITGTKGKSTTSSLIYLCLEDKFKEKVLLAGNIGKSLLDTVSLVKSDYLIILELSSFQLQACEQHTISPQYSLITNIYPDHLNYHQNMEEYINLKQAIARYQDRNGVVFLKKDDPITSREDFLKDLKGRKVYFSKDNLPQNFHPQLRGEHNLENIAATLAVAEFFGVHREKALQLIEPFPGIEFRMQLIYSREGIRIYNDSTATNPSAATQAVQSFPNCILIAGGMNKNLDYSEFAKSIDRNVRSVYFLEGDASEEIKSYLPNHDSQFTKVRGTYSDLEELLVDVKKEIKKGGVILFSPGATSFNLFQNEFDRGRRFSEAVKKVFG